MSVSGLNKRRARAKHRDQFSIIPAGTPLDFIVRKGGLTPLRTPLLDQLEREMSPPPLNRSQ
jgi:hypothetical protein